MAWDCETVVTRLQIVNAGKIINEFMYEGNSISKLQIQVATYVFELSAGNCYR